MRSNIVGRHGNTARSDVMRRGQDETQFLRRAQQCRTRTICPAKSAYASASTANLGLGVTVGVISPSGSSGGLHRPQDAAYLFGLQLRLRKLPSPVNYRILPNRSIADPSGTEPAGTRTSGIDCCIARCDVNKHGGLGAVPRGEAEANAVKPAKRELTKEQALAGDLRSLAHPAKDQLFEG